MTFTVFYANLLYGQFDEDMRASDLPDGAYVLNAIGRWFVLQSMQYHEIKPHEVPPQTRLTALLLCT